MNLVVEPHSRLYDASPRRVNAKHLRRVTGRDFIHDVTERSTVSVSCLNLNIEKTSTFSKRLRKILEDFLFEENHRKTFSEALIWN